MIGFFAHQNNKVTPKLFVAVEYAGVSAFRCQDSVPFLKFSLLVFFASSQLDNAVEVGVFQLVRFNFWKRLSCQRFPRCEKLPFRDDFSFYLDSFKGNQSFPSMRCFWMLKLVFFL